jgi:hypothetical protein
MVLRVVHLDLARDLEAARGRVDGAERWAKNFVDQRTAAKPMDPCAQKGEDVRVIAAGILLNDVQDVAIVLNLTPRPRLKNIYDISSSLEHNAS